MKNIVQIWIAAMVIVPQFLGSTNAAEEQAKLAASPKGYYADLGWRTPAGVANALEAAAKVLETDPEANIEFLVHGKDMRVFMEGAARRNPRLVALSERLASSGAKFRVCDHALSFKGVGLDDFPNHFGTVDYVPDRVNELKREGYSHLHEPPR
ncbi:MAG: hypothetical protein AAF387_02045 [Pseudomonadota bacterium]